MKPAAVSHRYIRANLEGKQSPLVPFRTNESAALEPKKAFEGAISMRDFLSCMIRSLGLTRATFSISELLVVYKAKTRIRRSNPRHDSWGLAGGPKCCGAVLALCFFDCISNMHLEGVWFAQGWLFWNWFERHGVSEMRIGSLKWPSWSLLIPNILLENCRLRLWSVTCWRDLGWCDINHPRLKLCR